MIYYPQAAITLNVLFEDFGGVKRKKTETYNLEVQAKRVTVNMNDYTQADTFTAEIDFKEFPFDPRCIRACGVTVHLENMKGLGKTIKPNPENTVFMGFADEEQIKLNSQSRLVTLEGRDYTSLLIDRKYLGGPVPLDMDLETIMNFFLLNLEETKNIKTVNLTGAALPKLADYAPDFNELGKKMNSRRDESYWDLIQRLSARSGLVCFIYLDQLIITKPRALYKSEKSKKFIFGHNLMDLEFKRKLGRMKNFNVKVSSMSIESKDVLEVKIPEDATDEWSKETGVPNKEPIMLPKVIEKRKDGKEKDPEPAPYMSFRIPNIASKSHLIKIGQEIFEEMGRQQIEGQLETREMEVMELSGDQFDILKLKVGDPISVEIEQKDMIALRQISGEDQASIKQARTQYLMARGYKPKFAAALAESLDQFSNLFYTKAATFTMDAEDGFKANIEFINFINLPERLQNGR